MCNVTQSIPRMNVQTLVQFDSRTAPYGRRSTRNSGSIGFQGFIPYVCCNGFPCRFYESLRLGVPVRINNITYWYEYDDDAAAVHWQINGTACASDNNNNCIEEVSVLKIRFTTVLTMVLNGIARCTIASGLGLPTDTTRPTWKM